MKRKYKNIYKHKSPVAYKNRAYSDFPSTPTTITAEGGVLGTGTKAQNAEIFDGVGYVQYVQYVLFVRLTWIADPVPAVSVDS
jgi:hypothetical protein